MKQLFSSVGFAVVLLLGTSVVNANSEPAGAAISATYEFDGATVVFMVTPCRDAEVLVNIKGYDHNPDHFYSATITFAGETTSVMACYQTALDGTMFDLHWGASQYSVERFSSGKDKSI